MNLSEHELIPFKTIGKTSTGNKWLFISNEGYGAYSHEFISMQNIGANYDEIEPDSDPLRSSIEFGEKVRFAANGRFDAGCEDQDVDIAFISKPWKPKEGDTVKVHGPVFPRDLSHPLWLIGERVVLGEHHVNHGPNEQFITSINGRDFVVHRRNIERIQ
jgi:hypothetical protein